MGLDFFGVFLQGQIQTFDSTEGVGKKYDLWIDQPEAGGSGAIPPELKALSFVSQISTEMRLGMNSKISLVLTPPFEEALAFLDSRLVQWGIGRLSVSFGYKGSGGGNIAGPFVGLLQQPAVQIGTDITITLTALGVGYALNLIGSGDPRSFPVGSSFADAVESLLSEVTAGHGVNMDQLYADFAEAKGTDPFFAEPAQVARKDASFSGPKGAEKRDAEIDLLDAEKDAFFATKQKEYKTTSSKSVRAKIERDLRAYLAGYVAEGAKIREKFSADQTPSPIIVGPRNSWWFIHETLRNYGKELLIKGDSVKVVASEEWLKKKTAQDGGWRKHFQVRGKTDPNRNMFPVLAFNSPSAFVYLNPGLGKYAMQEISDDKAKEKAAKKTYDDKNVNYTQTAPGKMESEKVTPVATKPTDATKNIPGSPYDPEAVSRAKGEWKRMQNDKGIVAQVTSIGVPTLLPGEVVQISGFLPRGKIGTKNKKGEPARGIFDGPYGVKKVVHSVGNGGYTTKFEGISNFQPAAWLNAARSVSSVTDVQEPKEDTDKPRVEVPSKDGT